MLTLIVVSHDKQFFVLNKWVSHCHQWRSPLFVVELCHIILVVISIVEVQFIAILLLSIFDFVALSFIHDCSCGALAEDLVSCSWRFRRILVNLSNFFFRHVWCRFFLIIAKVCQLVLIINVDNSCINQVSFINATNLSLLFFLTLVLKFHQFLMSALSIELVHVLCDLCTDQGWVVCLHGLMRWSLLVQSAHLFTGISAVVVLQMMLKLRHFGAFAR